MGSIFSGPKIPTPPPPPPPSTVRDEVNRVEQVPVTNADGSITYVTRTLPLTAEQQAQKNELDGIMSTALAEIKKLSATDYNDDAETKRVLDQWQTVQDNLVKKGFAARQVSEEETLARRGLGDSTAALDVRRTRALDAQEAEQKLALGRDSLSEQIRGERLGLQQNCTTLRRGKRMPHRPKPTRRRYGARAAWQPLMPSAMPAFWTIMTAAANSVAAAYLAMRWPAVWGERWGVALAVGLLGLWGAFWGVCLGISNTN